MGLVSSSTGTGRAAILLGRSPLGLVAALATVRRRGSGRFPPVSLTVAALGRGVTRGRFFFSIDFKHNFN